MIVSGTRNMGKKTKIESVDVGVGFVEFIFKQRLLSVSGEKS